METTSHNQVQVPLNEKYMYITGTHCKIPASNLYNALQLGVGAALKFLRSCPVASDDL